ncbi:hypothetical protein [Williamsia serinedens]|uniref:Crossover junction endodeoxyribonuclease RusA n=1 Tax=Williamsia serinedens TaxID=391736 RepID=A0ABT1H7D3_9NOCA|nr:hypothetical protein [Williamsia serinedens]MCP2163140.1 crossover junction endodeoxyribonuclease RusA [Williamsia serinedens]
MTDYILSIPLRRPPLTSNDQRRAHWTTVRNAKAEVEYRVRHAAQQARIGTLSAPQTVTVIWHAPDDRRRDSDSLSPFLKASLDALVKCGVLEDDCPPHVTSTSMRTVVDRANPRIEIQLQEAA